MTMFVLQWRQTSIPTGHGEESSVGMEPKPKQCFRQINPAVMRWKKDLWQVSRTSYARQCRRWQAPAKWQHPKASNCAVHRMPEQQWCKTDRLAPAAPQNASCWVAEYVLRQLQ